MVELVFSESACGALRFAQGIGGNYSGGASAVYAVGGGESGKELDEARRRLKEDEERCRNAEPLPKNEVLWINAALSFGDIGVRLWDGCKAAIKELCASSDATAAGAVIDAESAEKQRNAALERAAANAARLAERAKASEDIRIWAEPSPDGMCALLLAAEIINGTNAAVSVVPLTWTAGKYRGWGEVPVYMHSDAARHALPVEKDNIVAMAEEWRRLTEENAPLRAYVNGRVISVGEDFYDSVIMRHITDKPDTAGRVITRVLESLNVRAELILYRIKRMAESGRITADGVIGYGTVIRRA